MIDCGCEHKKVCSGMLSAATLIEQRCRPILGTGRQHYSGVSAIKLVCGIAAERGMAAGEGEFGIVHKAAFHGTLVAAKILKGSSAIALGDFRSEIEVLRKVHHPNAVQFLGACTKQEPYILVTGTERQFSGHMNFPA